MENTSNHKTAEPSFVSSKYITAGILAHVDAGKTTLSEAMLYTSGVIRKLGRVDSRDAFLDNYALERARGITIFSKQASQPLGEKELILLDTPGHVDFSTEMERTLQVLDYAVLVISGADGVQGHTRTLWRLLERYRIPVFLFVNKMDQPGTNREELMQELRDRLSGNCVDFTEDTAEEFYEEAAMCQEEALEEFLETGRVSREKLQEMTALRQIFPCYFGSALRLTGVEEFMDGLDRYTVCPEYPEEFGARVFKITRDTQNNRLTWLKITGGSLRVRETVSKPGDWEEKITQIRRYSGEKYETVEEVHAGEICTVTGLSRTWAGEGLGREPSSSGEVLEPVLSCRVVLPEGVDPAVMLPKLRMLEEEEPGLQIVWDQSLQEIQVRLMGDIQKEILGSLIAERFGVPVEFGPGKILYRETIADTVEGVGHFEPLRHYAEVHLLLEPGEPGSGLVFDTACSTDVLDGNWQRLILTHLAEKEHKGVLGRFPITDMHITLMSGKAHPKHTEGGDFRQATYRAVRQGLRQAQSVLLEPWYDFRLEVPEKMTGRAMADLEKMHGTFGAPEQMEGSTVLSGSAPVAEIQNYQQEVAAYTGGLGRLFLEWKGYAPCHNTEEVLEQTGYDPDRDLDNPDGSVFCSHGAGVYVEWDKVPEHMHLESCLAKEKPEEPGKDARAKSRMEDIWLGVEEVDAILERTFHANRKSESRGKGPYRKWKKEPASPVVYKFQKKEKKEEYLLVDGYNVIFAWEDLKELALENIDGARGKLLDVLSDYQGIRHCHLIVVFDAYKVPGHETEMVPWGNIHIVYTKEAETADQYIEKFAHKNAAKCQITVATSDGLEQIIIRSKGCALLSARELKKEIERARKEFRTEYLAAQPGQKSTMLDFMSEEGRKAFLEIGKDKR
ncbi:MAG TPA: TetM/TetW/TetO/TetS family tetracycline resistance ribosomal protection protein [Candidatus Bariatricus faecipullorum]|nr:TetM/TetW/TetO/TetS family tetracycline resistance ribosomal protection protein [Candidatus Bariatricus faecipullorum]